MAARLAPDTCTPNAPESTLHQPGRGCALGRCGSVGRSSTVTRWGRWKPTVRLKPVIVDDTGFVKKGTHSVGVARQCCPSQVGKPENCRVAVSLSVATAQIHRLHKAGAHGDFTSPRSIWAKDPERRSKARYSSKTFDFKLNLKLLWNSGRPSMTVTIAPAPVLGDTAYGNNYKFRHGITRNSDLATSSGCKAPSTVWKPGQGPLPPKSLTGRGRTPTRMQRNKKHQPVSVKQLALSLSPQRWKNVSWREGTSETLRSRFAAVRIRPAHLDHERHSPHPKEWLLVEWPKTASEPIRYWLSTLGAHTSLSDLAGQAKQRWIIERDYQELKQELGLGHYEGRGWRGFHHHGTLCIASYGFLVAERSRFSPSAFVEHVGLSVPKLPKHFKPRGTPDPARTT